MQSTLGKIWVCLVGTHIYDFLPGLARDRLRVALPFLGVFPIEAPAFYWAAHLTKCAPFLYRVETKLLVPHVTCWIEVQKQCFRIGWCSGTHNRNFVLGWSPPQAVTSRHKLSPAQVRFSWRPLPMFPEVPAVQCTSGSEGSPWKFWKAP